MSDWQGVSYDRPFLSTFGIHSGGAGSDLAITNSPISTAGAWPAANRALYVPVVVPEVCTAYQMAFIVGTQSGNYDIGIYDELGNRLVSKGSTAVPAAGVAVTNITDTTLNPGVVFLALNIDNTTATVNRSSSLPALYLETLGVQQQAVGAVTLPDPATFANPASAYMPLVMVSTLQATI